MSGNLGNDPPDNRDRGRNNDGRDLDNSEKLNVELQRLRQIADRMERDRRRGVLGQMAINGVARSIFAGMFFMLIILMTLHGFLRIFQNFYNALF